MVLEMWLATARGGDWPQFLGPTRNSISTEMGLVSSWSKDGPPLVWQRETGAGFSGPAVAGENLILFHRVGDEEVVECLEASTGKSRWKFSYPTHYIDQFGFDPGPRSTPLIAGGKVYTLGAEGAFHCLDLDSGKKIWGRPLNEEFTVAKGFFGVATSPLIEGELILVNVGGKDAAGIVAFARDTGQEVWRATDHQASYSSPVAATLAGIRYAIFLTREGIVFLDPKTGSVKFNTRFRSRMNASVNAASPLAVDNTVFFSACYGPGAMLLAVAGDRFDEVWKNDESMSNHYNTCVADNGYLYGFHGRQESGARLRCVELKTGQIKWTSERAGCGSVILAEGKLIVLAEDGDLILIQPNPDSYKELARASVMSKPARSPIALANGRLYARDSKKLVCFNLKK
jgi:outer membrane protein assembly factor BamB